MISVFFLSKKPELAASFMSPQVSSMHSLNIVLYAIANEPLSIVTGGQHLTPNLVLKDDVDPLVVERDLTPSRSFSANLLLREQLSSFQSDKNRSYSYSLTFHEDLTNPRVVTHQLDFSTSSPSTIAVYKYFGDQTFSDYVSAKSIEIANKRYLVRTEKLDADVVNKKDGIRGKTLSHNISSAVLSALVNPEVMIPAIITSGVAIFLNRSRHSRGATPDRLGTLDVTPRGESKRTQLRKEKKLSILEMLSSRQL